MPVRFGVSTRCLQERHHVEVELSVVIEDPITVRPRVGKRFPQLLQYPVRRMCGDVEVQYLAATVLDHEKAVEELKRARWHREEVKRGDGFSMVRQERTPSAGRVAAPSNLLQLPGTGAFGNFEPELQKFGVDARRSPP